MNSDALHSFVVKSLPAFFECAPAAREGVRVRTPLMYPDGGVVDVFVVERDGGCQVTDFGEALGWLRMQSLSARRSPKQNRMVEDTCRTLGVELHHGQLTLRSVGFEVMEEAVLRFARAVVRVSNLGFALQDRAAEGMAGDL